MRVEAFLLIVIKGSGVIYLIIQLVDSSNRFIIIIVRYGSRIGVRSIIRQVTVLD